MTKEVKIVLFIAIIIIVAGLIFVLWPSKPIDNGQNVNSQPVNINGQPIENNEPEIIISNIDMANWQIYTNEEYNYQISYPNNEVTIVTDRVLERGTEGNPGFKLIDGGHFAIGIYDNMDKLPAREWLDQKYAGYSGKWFGIYQDDKINEVDVVRAIADNRTPDDPYQCYVEWVIIKKDFKLYTIAGEFCDTEEYSVKLFDAIVSTFKFINN